MAIKFSGKEPPPSSASGYDGPGIYVVERTSDWSAYQARRSTNVSAKGDNSPFYTVFRVSPKIASRPFSKSNSVRIYVDEDGNPSQTAQVIMYKMLASIHGEDFAEKTFDFETVNDFLSAIDGKVFIATTYSGDTDKKYAVEANKPMVPALLNQYAARAFNEFMEVYSRAPNETYMAVYNEVVGRALSDGKLFVNTVPVNGLPAAQPVAAPVAAAPAQPAAPKPAGAPTFGSPSIAPPVQPVSWPPRSGQAPF